MKIENSAKGFTLVETVVVVTISTLMLLALVNFFFTFNSIYGYQHAFIAAAGSAGTAMNAFEASILPASQVLASHDFSGTIYSSDADTLVLALPAADSSGNIIPGANDYVAFYISSGTLYRRVAADAGSMRASGLKQLSTTVYSLALAYDDEDFANVTNVVVDLETRAQFKEQVVESRLREQLYLRNLPLLPAP